MAEIWLPLYPKAAGDADQRTAIEMFIFSFLTSNLKKSFQIDKQFPNYCLLTNDCPIDNNGQSIVVPHYEVYFFRLKWFKL